MGAAAGALALNVNTCSSALPTREVGPAGRLPSFTFWSIAILLSLSPCTGDAERGFEPATPTTPGFSAGGTSLLMATLPGGVAGCWEDARLRPALSVELMSTEPCLDDTTVLLPVLLQLAAAAVASASAVRIASLRPDVRLTTAASAAARSSSMRIRRRQ